MDSKKIKTLSIISGGVLLAGGLLYYLLSKNTLSTEQESKYTTLEEIIDMAHKEAEEANSDLKKSDKASPIFTKEFTIKVFYILSKYATLLKRSSNEIAFLNRIELLKEGKETEYY